MDFGYPFGLSLTVRELFGRDVWLFLMDNFYAIATQIHASELDPPQNRFSLGSKTIGGQTLLTMPY